jgi:hypothetical protein
MYYFSAETDRRHFRRTTPAIDNPALPLPGLSPFSGERTLIRVQ